MPSSTERHELAERLHDGPQQHVTAIRLLADASRKALDAGDLDAARRSLDRIGITADDLAEDLRNEVTRLRDDPPPR